MVWSVILQRSQSDQSNEIHNHWVRTSLIKGLISDFIPSESDRWVWLDVCIIGPDWMMTDGVFVYFLFSWKTLIWTHLKPFCRSDLICLILRCYSLQDVILLKIQSPSPGPTWDWDEDLKRGRTVQSEEGLTETWSVSYPSFSSQRWKNCSVCLFDRHCVPLPEWSKGVLLSTWGRLRSNCETDSS